MRYLLEGSAEPVFFIGTRAEMIKVKPVILRLRNLGVRTRVVWTGLHGMKTLENLESEGVSTFFLSGQEKDQETIPQVLLWFLKSLFSVLRASISLRMSGERSFPLIVHGDTLSTLLGAIFGKLGKLQVMHIEAAVRSGSLLRPFPEEITRRIVSHLTKVHFAPGKKEFKEASKFRGIKVNTFHNTSRDALYEAVKDICFEQGDYIVVTLHRAELLSSKKVFRETVMTLIQVSETKLIKWFVGNHERAVLRERDLLNLVLDSKIQLCDRVKHEEFVEVFARAKCVVTDSGGLQSECNDLGIPVIVHRSETEYENENDSPCVLTFWDSSVIVDFIETLDSNTYPRGILKEPIAAEIITRIIMEQMDEVSHQ